MENISLDCLNKVWVAVQNKGTLLAIVGAYVFWDVCKEYFEKRWI
jgi:hypothetical protein